MKPDLKPLNSREENATQLVSHQLSSTHRTVDIAASLPDSEDNSIQRDPAARAPFSTRGETAEAGLGRSAVRRPKKRRIFYGSSES